MLELLNHLLRGRKSITRGVGGMADEGNTVSAVVSMDRSM
jgi:hypothetical protein